MSILTHNYIEILVKAINDSFKLSKYPQVKNYFELINYLDLSINDAIRNGLVKMFETMDQDFGDSKFRKSKYHKKGKHQRRICTIFGEITFKREYYSPIHGGDSFFYVDRELDLPFRDYYDPLIKALIVEKYSKHSYAESGNLVAGLIGTKFKTLEDTILNKIPRQTVFNIVHAAEFINVHKAKSDVKSLYIQLDEKYVHTQNTNRSPKMIKIAVIYTGKERVYHNRYKLKKRFVIASDESADTIRMKILHYINDTYNVDGIENVILSGDGAEWIENCKTIFKFNKYTNVIYILDKFHTHQAINHITKGDEYKQLLRDYLNHDMKKDFIVLCNFIIYSSPNRKEIIEEKRNYIIKNWNAIQRQKSKLNLGCSVEGHVSHVLAAKLTARPKGYSLKRLSQTVSIRSMYVNKVDIKESYLANNTDYVKSDKLIIKITDDRQPILNILNNRNSGLCHYIRKIS